ncbi:hypothetical protein B566_EDAN006236 [Ephemera danica]|nr:hypothetical protein B566_EDAN006236 [Ephemera danica]
MNGAKRTGSGRKCTTTQVHSYMTAESREWDRSQNAWRRTENAIKLQKLTTLQSTNSTNGQKFGTSREVLIACWSINNRSLQVNGPLARSSSRGCSCGRYRATPPLPCHTSSAMSRRV